LLFTNDMEDILLSENTITSLISLCLLGASQNHASFFIASGSAAGTCRTAFCLKF
jgi:hypothetical protein